MKHALAAGLVALARAGLRPAPRTASAKTDPSGSSGSGTWASGSSSTGASTARSASVISHSMVGASEDYLERYVEELPRSFNPEPVRAAGVGPPRPPRRLHLRGLHRQAPLGLLHVRDRHHRLLDHEHALRPGRDARADRRLPRRGAGHRTLLLARRLPLPLEAGDPDQPAATRGPAREQPRAPGPRPGPAPGADEPVREDRHGLHRRARRRVCGRSSGKSIPTPWSPAGPWRPRSSTRPGCPWRAPGRAT